MDASLAPSTRRSYPSGQSRFLQFCTSFRLLHPSGSPYQASESTLELFASYLSSSLTHQTIKCHLAAVRSLHIERGLPDPLSNAPRLELVLRGIKRSQAARYPANPDRLPVTRATLLTIRGSLNLSAPDDYMFWAAACTAWFVFLGVSEFTCPASGFDPATHLSVQDLAVDDHQLPSAVLVRIKASKTDPFRKGVQLLLPRTGGPLCPVDALSSYLSIRGNAHGPLFRFASGVPLSHPHVTNWLRSTLAAAGAQGNYSSHSFQIGAATTAHAAGVPDSLIRTLGRWSSDAYLVYIQTSHDTLRSAAARLASDPGSDPLSSYPSSSVPLEPQGFPLFPGPAFPAWRPPSLWFGGWRRLPSNRPSILGQSQATPPFAPQAKQRYRKRIGH